MNPPTAPDAGANAPRPVPTGLITGADAGERLHALQAMLRERPPGQTWALITPDLAILEKLAATPGLKAALVAPGCLCCTGLLPFRVGLVRLLRAMAAAPPARLLVDTGASLHAQQMQVALQGAQFAPLIRLEPGPPLSIPTGAHDVDAHA
jgi:hypothetical protein